MASKALLLLAVSQLSCLYVNGDSYLPVSGETNDVVKETGTRNVLDQERTSEETKDDKEEETEGREEEEEKAEEGAFRFKRVSSEEAENGYKVTITFEGEIELPVYIRFDWARNEPVERYGTVDQERGQVEVFLAEPAPEYPAFVFKSGDNTYLLGIHVNDTDRFGARERPNQQDIPNAQSFLKPGNDVTYSSGSDAELDVRFTLKDGEDGYASREEHCYWTAVVMPAGSENLAYLYHQFSRDIPPSFPRLDTPTWQEKRKTADGKTLAVHFVINATEDDTDAVFELMCEFLLNCSEDQACLLGEMGVSREVYYYRNDRDGPLPPHLLAFARHWHDVVEQNSLEAETFQRVGFNDSDDCDGAQEEQKNVIWCGVDGEEPCEIRTIVLSEEKLANLEIRNVQSKVPVTNMKYFVTKTAYGFWQESVATFENPTFGDSGEYVCTAETSSRAIRQTFILKVVDFAKIDHEQSKITAHHNGSLEAVCKAHGVPAPEVEFDNSTYSSLAELPANEYHITYSKEGNLTVARLTISDPDWAGRVYGLQCKAVNTDHSYYGYDWYYMSRNEQSDWFSRK